MTTPVAPIEAVSSKGSEEIEPKAGIAIANRKGQFAPKEGEVFIKINTSTWIFTHYESADLISLFANFRVKFEHWN